MAEDVFWMGPRVFWLERGLSARFIFIFGPAEGSGDADSPVGGADNGSVIADARAVNADARAVIADARAVIADARAVIADARAVIADARASNEDLWTGNGDFASKNGVGENFRDLPFRTIKSARPVSDAISTTAAVATN